MPDAREISAAELERIRIANSVIMAQIALGSTAPVCARTAPPLCETCPTRQHPQFDCFRAPAQIARGLR